MSKKVVILGGGTGTSTLVRGLKEFPVDISVVVSVSDDGRSTGRLREVFDIPAVGDLRQVLSALSETEPLFEKLLNYRFETNNDLNGHAVGNLLLAALCNITGNMSDGLKSLSNVLNLKGKVLPLTEDNCILMGKMEDDSIIEGEHNITKSDKKVKDVFYKEDPTVNPEVIESIKNADMIILSMGSLYTSITCNLVCDDVIKAIDESKGKILYVCNMFTQPGETDNFTVSDHLKVLNNHLGKRKIDTVIINDGKIPKKFIEKYHREEEKDPVIIDKENINKMNVKIIKDDFIKLRDKGLKHDAIKLSLRIFEDLIKEC
ncbi:MAG: uridine diphosphate-N-acetylglucosamine-binding protein YvcK [Candidatus Aphodocola sp.]